MQRHLPTLRPGSQMVPLSLGVLYLTAPGLLCNGAGAGGGGVRGFRADLVARAVKALLTAPSKKWTLVPKWCANEGSQGALTCPHTFSDVDTDGVLRPLGTLVPCLSLLKP